MYQTFTNQFQTVQRFNNDIQLYKFLLKQFRCKTSELKYIKHENLLCI